MYNLEISAVGSAPYTVQLIQHNLRLEKDQWYEVSFEASANTRRTLEVNVEQHEDPWDSYLKEISNFEIGTAPGIYSLKFQMTAATDTNGRLSFNAGASTGTVVLDNVSLKKIEAPVVVPEESRGDSTSRFLGAEFSTGTPQTFGVYSLSGQFLGEIFAGSAEISPSIKNLVKKSGAYLIKSGLTARLVQVK